MSEVVSKPSKKPPLEEAINILGNTSRLAISLGITPWAVSKWNISRPPKSRCLAIQELTKNLVTAEQLRPDVNWDYERKHREFSKPLPIAKKTNSSIA